ncbi:MAG: bifunctional 3'-5' exonuclease/DNA polymerase [Kocuria rhizophila]|nr:bifunctional 3'-5' exonuclease/DNA polymerase [Kocuria rhizophila]
MRPMHIVVAAAEPGTWVLRVVSADGERAGDDLTVTDAEFPRLVAQREEAAHRAGVAPPVWTWLDTSVPVALLNTAGVWVSRCRDLGLCSTILTTASTAPGSGAPPATAPAGNPTSGTPPQTQNPRAGGTYQGTGTAVGSEANVPHPLDYRPVVDPPAARHAPGPRAPVAANQGSLFAVASETGPGIDELTAELAAQTKACASARNPARLGRLLGLESQGALVAEEMRHRGIPWNTEVHRAILEDLLGPEPRGEERPARMQELAERVREVLAAPTLNPDSPVELLKALRNAGVDVDTTRAWKLQDWTLVNGQPQEQRVAVVAPVLEYKKLSRVFSATGWHWLETWVQDGRFHPEYVVGGVVTGRWAARGGGALQIPKYIRDAVRAEPGRALVVADAAQLEPRVLAILARDDALAEASRGRDLYASIAEQGQARRTELTERADAKVALLGAMYGATSGAAGRFMPQLTRLFPRAVGYVEHAARVGERGQQVCTYLGRWSPAPGPEWFEVQRATDTEAGEHRATREARSHGRFSRNFVVQGSAAEWALAWLGLIRQGLHRSGLDARLVFFLHDEVMVDCAEEHAEQVRELVVDAAEQAVRTVFGTVPVEVPVATNVVRSYAEAK